MNGLKQKKTECVPSENLDTALNTLREHGLKLTPTRKLVLSFLTKAHGPFTMEEIHAGIRRKSCNLATIYRIISTLEEVGLVRRTDLGDGVARYEYLCAEHPHQHIVCKKCKKIEIIDTNLVSQIEKIAKKQGFASINPCFEVFGICRNCSG